MKHLFRILLFVSFLWMVAACGDDKYHFPSVVKEFYVGYTGADGRLQYMETDRGERLEITDDRSGMKGTPDSVYRLLGYYEILSQERALIHSAGRVSSPFPKPLHNIADSLSTDAVRLISIWQAPRYINMHLGIKFAENNHECAFVEDSVRVTEARTHLWLTLYHDAHGDGEGFYTEDIYLSVPLERYLHSVSGPLTVHFSLNTFEEGLKEFRFDYN